MERDLAYTTEVDKERDCLHDGNRNEEKSNLSAKLSVIEMREEPSS